MEIDSPPDAMALSGYPPGLVVVPDEDQAVASLSRFLASPGGVARGWMGAVAAGAPGTLRILDPGATEAAQPIDGEEADKLGTLFHSINNALTAAMAETQLSLMNDLDEEMYASLKTVEAKLRLIRDLVATARPKRAPTAPSREPAAGVAG